MSDHRSYTHNLSSCEIEIMSSYLSPQFRYMIFHAFKQDNPDFLLIQAADCSFRRQSDEFGSIWDIWIACESIPFSVHLSLIGAGSKVRYFCESTI